METFTNIHVLMYIQTYIHIYIQDLYKVFPGFQSDVFTEQIDISE